MTADTYSVPEAAARLGMTDDLANRQIRDGIFPLDVLPIQGRRRIPVAQVEFFVTVGRRHTSVAELAEFVRILRGAA